jgi:hypothetical protein
MFSRSVSAVEALPQGRKEGSNNKPESRTASKSSGSMKSVKTASKSSMKSVKSSSNSSMKSVKSSTSSFKSVEAWAAPPSDGGVSSGLAVGAPVRGIGHAAPDGNRTLAVSASDISLHYTNSRSASKETVQSSKSRRVVFASPLKQSPGRSPSKVSPVRNSPIDVVIPVRNTKSPEGSNRDRPVRPVSASPDMVNPANLKHGNPMKYQRPVSANYNYKRQSDKFRSPPRSGGGQYSPNSNSNPHADSPLQGPNINYHQPPNGHPPDHWIQAKTDVWQVLVTQTGKVYYHNLRTKISQWDPPEGIRPYENPDLSKENGENVSKEGDKDGDTVEGDKDVNSSFHWEMEEGGEGGKKSGGGGGGGKTAGAGNGTVRGSGTVDSQEKQNSDAGNNANSTRDGHKMMPNGHKLVAEFHAPMSDSIHIDMHGKRRSASETHPKPTKKPTKIPSKKSTKLTRLEQKEHLKHRSQQKNSRETTTWSIARARKQKVTKEKVIKGKI